MTYYTLHTYGLLPLILFVQVDFGLELFDSAVPLFHLAPQIRGLGVNLGKRIRRRVGLGVRWLV